MTVYFHSQDTDDYFATFLAHIEAISPLFNTAAQASLENSHSYVHIKETLTTNINEKSSSSHSSDASLFSRIFRRW